VTVSFLKALSRASVDWQRYRQIYRNFMFLTGCLYVQVRHFANDVNPVSGDDSFSMLMARSGSTDKNSLDYPLTTPLKFTTRLSVAGLNPHLLIFLFKFTSYNLSQVCCMCTRFSLCKQSLSYSRPALHFMLSLMLHPTFSS
jgi:hypothetical protein